MFEDLKAYAIENQVPIVKDEGLDFLLSSIKKYNVKDILEVGCAIGYSALNMSLYDTLITTLERNEEMYNLAKENVNRYQKNDSIEIVYTDALDYTPNREFDMIFIDAAKAQNQKFFLRFTPFLRKNGIVIVDNLNFHGLTDDVQSIKSKNLRSMVKKINDFKIWLKDNNEYDTSFFDLGDGMSISIKK